MTPETDDGGSGGGGGSSSRTSSSSSLLEELKREMVELRGQLERERRIRHVVEEEKLQLEEQLTAAHTERLGGGAGAAGGGGGGAGGGDGGHARIPDIHARIPFYYPPPVHEEKYMVPPPAGTQYVFSPGAIKTEQERPTPATPPPPPQQQQNPPSPIASQMSRQNLETIVQAIRHLEGEIFNDDLSVDKENSIARKEARKSLVSEKHPVLKDELHRPIAATQFNRPGVIVQS
ncbi:PREDICTED: transcription factor AP-4-like [Priapulus caudatus]|uniref:Transcription factor AP-4-like n=1 Tax=Priapulus caudatus TaxID=37621 RepID=A0ABM1F9P4_PRICU|nr:PREDICTED: transcription factor AP-4-like [Priapulus caudatus]